MKLRRIRCGQVSAVQHESLRQWLSRLAKTHELRGGRDRVEPRGEVPHLINLVLLQEADDLLEATELIRSELNVDRSDRQVLIEAGMLSCLADNVELSS